MSDFDYQHLTEYLKRYRATLFNPEYPLDIIESRGRWLKKVPLFYNGDYVALLKLNDYGLTIGKTICIGNSNPRKFLFLLASLYKIAIKLSVPLWGEAINTSFWKKISYSHKTVFSFMIISPNAHDPWDQNNPDEVLDLNIPIEFERKYDLTFDIFGTYIHFEKINKSSYEIIESLSSMSKVIFITSYHDSIINQMYSKVKNNFNLNLGTPFQLMEMAFLPEANKKFEDHYRPREHLFPVAKVVLEGNFYDL